jgi:hypothetical protein
MNEEELKEAEYFASLLLTDEELNDVLELPAMTVQRALSSRDNELGKAIRKGRMLTKCELHESILTTARRHSTPAQQMAADLLRKIDSQ